MKKPSLLLLLLFLFPFLALAADPQMDQIRNLVRKKNWSAVISRIESGEIDTSKDEKPIWDFLYGYALEESGRYRESLEPLAQAASANSPISDYALYFLGKNSAKLDDLDRAETSYKIIRPQSYISLPARLALTKIYLDSGRLDQAGKELGLLKNSKIPERLAPEKSLLEAKLDQAQGRADSADRKFRDFQINYPLYKPAPKREDLPVLSGEESLARCRKLIALGAVKQARKELESLISETKESDRELISQALGNLAESRFRNRDYKSVATLERSAEQYAKNNPQYWFYLAWSYQRLDDEKKAAKYYIKCANEFGSPDFSARSLYHLARMEMDKRRTKSAQEYFRLLVEAYPESEFCEDAEFQLGLLAYEQGNFEKAIKSFYSALQFGSEPDRFKYWLAKSYEGYGEPERASRLRQELLKQYPASVYSFLIDPCPGPDNVSIAKFRFSPAMAPENFKTGLILAWLGVYGLAEAELSWQIQNQPASNKDLVYMIDQLENFQAYPLAFKYFRAALAPRLKPEESSAYYEYLFPLAFSDLILPAAKKYGIEPAFAYSLIKQESAFNPVVSSSAGAMGLTQVMPPLARKQAKCLGYANLSTDDYFDPEINIELGFSHLAELLQRYDGAGAYPWQMILVGCAYNAGMGRADRWFLGAAEKGTDPDLFIERIPFLETRNYIKKVLSGLRIYRVRIENNPARCP